MEILSESEFEIRAYPALRRLFINEDPYGNPFAPDVERRELLSHYSWDMSPPLIDAVVNAATARGEAGFFITIFGRPPEAARRQPYHWYIPYTDLASYKSLVGPLENATYSPQATWGIMGSNEHFGLLAGTHEMVEAILQPLPDTRTRVFEFLEIIHRVPPNPPLYWAPRLLSNIYGSEQTEAFLEYWRTNSTHDVRHMFKPE